MSFEGVIEDFCSKTIFGWDSYLNRGNRNIPCHKSVLASFNLDHRTGLRAARYLRGATFDPNASHDVVPDRMRAANAV